MDRRAAFEEMLAKVDPDKRDEAYAKLAAVETRAEKLAIFESYGVRPSEVFSDGWEGQAHELSDEELDQVAGGFDWEETWHSRDCNCEP